MKHLTRNEERDRHSRRVQVAVGLECHLRNLMRDIRGGDVAKLVDFQQYIQYAPDAMRERIGALARKEGACN